VDDRGLIVIGTTVSSAYTEPAFDLDENKIGKWETRVERKKTIPTTMRGRKIFHEIHSGLKHTSVITCVSVGGGHMIPFLVSSHVSDAVVRKLKTEGFRIGIDTMRRKEGKPYVNAMFFYEYISIASFHTLQGCGQVPGLRINQRFF
jgi:hypothetical protein